MRFDGRQPRIFDRSLRERGHLRKIRSGEPDLRIPYPLQHQQILDLRHRHSGCWPQRRRPVPAYHQARTCRQPPRSAKASENF